MPLLPRFGIYRQLKPFQRYSKERPFRALSYASLSLPLLFLFLPSVRQSNPLLDVFTFKLFSASSPWNNCHTLCTARFFLLLSPSPISGGSISTAAAEETPTNNKPAANNGSPLSVWLACLAWPNTVILAAAAVPPVPPHNHRPPASSSYTWEGKH